MTHDDMVHRAQNRPPSTGEPINPNLLAFLVLRMLSPRLAPLLRRPRSANDRETPSP